MTNLELYNKVSFVVEDNLDGEAYCSNVQELKNDCLRVVVQSHIDLLQKVRKKMQVDIADPWIDHVLLEEIQEIEKQLL